MSGLDTFVQQAGSAGGEDPRAAIATLLSDLVGVLTTTVNTERYILVLGSPGDFDGIVKWVDDMHKHEVYAADNLKPFLRDRGITLKGDEERVYNLIVSNFNPELQELAEGDESFQTSLRSYIHVNRADAVFDAERFADTIAKMSNGVGRLVVPKNSYSTLSVDEMLDEVVGLESVKDTVRQLQKYADYRRRAKADGHVLANGNMHMLFMGNPGTGKTMVARSIATMLYKIGITRRALPKEVSAKDLIAKYVGQTAPKVHDEVEDALGGVLFIDEAYSLMPHGEDSNDFGPEAIAELIKCMEDYKDDLIVIFAGYENEMQEFVDSNPGLSSRIGYKFHFEDYSVDELLEIFKLKTKGTLKLGEGVEDELSQLFEYFSRFKSFGNGRFVDNVLQRATVKHAERVGGLAEDSDEDPYLLTREDIPTRQEMFAATGLDARRAEEQLEGLVGLESVKKEVLALEKVVTYREAARAKGVKLPDLNLNMIMQGNPGTGKTTIARIIASVLYNVGAVPSDHFKEIEAQDLLSSGRDDTATNTKKIVDRAMGGVLFLDEAYALLYDPRGREALAVLVKAMEDHKGEFVVMFAGYRREMRAFIDENPGLASRIGYTFNFEDYEVDELQEIFRRKMEASHLELGEGVLEEARKAFKYFHGVEDFGNGRFVDRYIQALIATHAEAYDPEYPERIGVESLPTIERLCETSATKVVDISGEEEAEVLKRVARHEAGHAVCRLVASGETDIVLITIESEGNGAAGYVQHKVRGGIPTVKEWRDNIVCVLGGMAAEEVYYGEASAGVVSDLGQATWYAAQYVARFGMSKIGLVQYIGERFDSADIAKLPQPVLDEMAHVLDECRDEAREVIKANRASIDAIVAALEERSTMTGEELVEVWEQSRQHADA